MQILNVKNSLSTVIADVIARFLMKNKAIIESGNITLNDFALSEIVEARLRLLSDFEARGLRHHYPRFYYLFDVGFYTNADLADIPLKISGVLTLKGLMSLLTYAYVNNFATSLRYGYEISMDHDTKTLHFVKTVEERDDVITFLVKLLNFESYYHYTIFDGGIHVTHLELSQCSDDRFKIFIDLGAE